MLRKVNEAFEHGDAQFALLLAAKKQYMRFSHEQYRTQICDQLEITMQTGQCLSVHIFAYDDDYAGGIRIIASLNEPYQDSHALMTLATLNEVHCGVTDVSNMIVDAIITLFLEYFETF
jgi:hypothetical protein